MNEIEAFIRKGISDAYFQNLFLKKPDNDLQFNITEYICTVNVAQKLLHWIDTTEEGKNHIIQIEYDATQFKCNAFLPFVWKEDKTIEITGRKFYRRLKHVPIREGRIDICVMRRKRLGETGIFLRSVSAIEVKAINPQTKLIIDDVLRLSDAICSKDDVSENNIQECFVAFCKRLDNNKELFEGNDFDERCAAFKNELEKEITADLLGKFNISISLKTWVILKCTVAEYVEPYPEDERDARDIADYTGAVIGVLIKLERV